MSELILHHYAMSPYAEKIRLCLGLKGLEWRSVDTPMVMPKPDHVELTGGYRRVPVLQVGADIYCDTACIARELDRRFPEPALYPPGQETVAHSLCQWSETSFMMVVLAFFGIGGVFPPEFVEDRRNTMVPPGTNLDAAPMIVGTKLLQIQANLARLETQLADGRDYLLGASACVADTAAYHPLMFLGAHERTAALLAPHATIRAWMERVRELGHGSSSPLDSSAAIAVAKSAEPAAFAGEPVLPDGMSIGDPVLVLPDEYGSGNVAGTLAASGLHEIAIRRESERAGSLVVHFPRETYGVIATS
jgi:glutathione S-transferase